MIRSTRILLAAILLVAATARSSADDTNSANYVMSGCRDWLTGSHNDPLKQGYCAGLIKATFRFGDVCSSDATVDQMIRVVVQYIDSRPARLNEDFLNLANEAMRVAWPCRR